MADDTHAFDHSWEQMIEHHPERFPVEVKQSYRWYGMHPPSKTMPEVRMLFETLIIGDYGQFLGTQSTNFQQAASLATQVVARRFYQSYGAMADTTGCTADQLLEFLSYFQSPNNDTFPNDWYVLNNLRQHSDPANYPANVLKLNELRYQGE